MPISNLGTMFFCHGGSLSVPAICSHGFHMRFRLAQGGICEAWVVYCHICTCDVYHIDVVSRTRNAHVHEFHVIRTICDAHFRKRSA